MVAESSVAAGVGAGAGAGVTVAAGAGSLTVSLDELSTCFRAGGVLAGCLVSARCRGAAAAALVPLGTLADTDGCDTGAGAGAASAAGAAAEFTVVAAAWSVAAEGVACAAGAAAGRVLAGVK
jgi:hypothetical protein